MHRSSRGQETVQMEIHAADQHYNQFDRFIYLGGGVADDSDMTFEIDDDARAMHKL